MCDLTCAERTEICQNIRQMLTGYKFRWENCYNRKLTQKEKEWICRQANVDPYTYQGSLRKWNEFNQEELIALSRTLNWLLLLVGKFPKAMSRNEFMRVTE